MSEPNQASLQAARELLEAYNRGRTYTGTILDTARAIDTACEIARREQREAMCALLREHWPTISCDHEAQTDTPACSCSLVKFEPQTSVGAAIRAWAEHVRNAAAIRSNTGEQ